MKHALDFRNKRRRRSTDETAKVGKYDRNAQVSIQGPDAPIPDDGRESSEEPQPVQPKPRFYKGARSN